MSELTSNYSIINSNGGKFALLSDIHSPVLSNDPVECLSSFGSSWVSEVEFVNVKKYVELPVFGVWQLILSNALLLGVDINKPVGFFDEKSGVGWFYKPLSNNEEAFSGDMTPAGVPLFAGANFTVDQKQIVTEKGISAADILLPSPIFTPLEMKQKKDVENKKTAIVLIISFFVSALLFGVLYFSLLSINNAKVSKSLLREDVLNSLKSDLIVKKIGRDEGFKSETEWLTPLIRLHMLFENVAINHLTPKSMTATAVLSVGTSEMGSLRPVSMSDIINSIKEESWIASWRTIDSSSIEVSWVKGARND